MADTVSTNTVYSGLRRKVTEITCTSDGTGETDVVKIDISTFTDANGKTATYMAIDYVQYAVWGFSSVVLEFDAATDTRAFVLSGNGVLDFVNDPMTDPKGSGYTGDLLLTSNSPSSSAGYNIVIHWRPKA